MVIFRILGWLIVCQVFAAGERSFIRRPVWNIAHMVNAIHQVDYYLNYGANAIEFDILFSDYGNALYTFHGVPCDCFRDCLQHERIERFLNHMRQLTTPGYSNFKEQLVLLVFDLKMKKLSGMSKRRAGESIANILMNHYWLNGASGGRAYILLSMPFTNNILEFIRSFQNTLRSRNFQRYEEKVGFDFYGNEDYNEINRMLRSEGITERIWQGAGRTNCLPKSTDSLERAIRKRRQPRHSYIKKVYIWTVDKKSTMRNALRLEVDAIMTNDPHDFTAVLKEEEFSRRFYLATIADNPWQTHILDYHYYWMMLYGN